MMDHYFILDQYLFDTFTHEDKDSLTKYFLHNPVECYWTLQDYLITDKEKIKKLINSLNDKYVLFICIASPGFGKTSTMLTILERYKLIYNRKLYQLATEVPCSLFDGVVYDLDNVPNDCDCYVDELAQVYPARDFQSVANKKITQELITLRHRNIRLFGCCQKARLVDLNVIDFSTHKLIKYLDNVQYERDNFLTEFAGKLVPSDRFNKSECLFLNRETISTFEFQPDKKFFSDEISKNKSIKLNDEQVKNKSIMLFKAGYSIMEIQKKILKDNNSRLDISFLKKDFSIPKEL